jgi:hypothetical protein
VEPLSNGAGVLAALWGFVEADSTIVGILVAAVGVLAVTYVVLRLRRSRAATPRGGDDRS